METEELEGAGDKFAVEALADEDGGSRLAKVIGAGEYALVPEAVDFSAGGEAVEGRRDARFRYDFKAPRAAYDHEQGPGDSWDDGQGQALCPFESGGGGHVLIVARAVSVRCEVGKAGRRPLGPIENILRTPHWF